MNPVPCTRGCGNLTDNGDRICDACKQGGTQLDVVALFEQVANVFGLEGEEKVQLISAWKNALGLASRNLNALRKLIDAKDRWDKIALEEGVKAVIEEIGSCVPSERSISTTNRFSSNSCLWTRRTWYVAFDFVFMALICVVFLLYTVLIFSSSTNCCLWPRST